MIFTYEIIIDMNGTSNSIAQFSKESDAIAYKKWWHEETGTKPSSSHIKTSWVYESVNEGKLETMRYGV